MHSRRCVGLHHQTRGHPAIVIVNARMVALIPNYDMEDQAMTLKIRTDIESLEMDLLLQAIFQRFGRDFRHYNREHLMGNLRSFLAAHSLPNLSALQEKILHDASYIEPLLKTLGNNQYELFDNPARWKQLRESLVPWLRSCPSPNVWLVDPQTAEQIFWLPILLQEENLYRKTRIYVTSSHAQDLAEAKRGRFSKELFAQYENNYQGAGGVNSLGDYCTAIENEFVFHPELHSNITWAEYHLGQDASLNEFETIICCVDLSNVSMQLRQKVHNVFCESQPMFGLLIIIDENFSASVAIPHYRALYNMRGVYQRR